jgi:hypothetical protein
LNGFRNRTHGRDCWFKITRCKHLIHWRHKQLVCICHGQYILMNVVTPVLPSFVDLFSALSCLHYFRSYCMIVANVTHWRQGAQGKQKKTHWRDYSSDIWFTVAEICFYKVFQQGWSFVLPTSFRLWCLIIVWDARKGVLCLSFFWNRACLPWQLRLTCTVTIGVFGFSYIQHNLQVKSPATFAYECSSLIHSSILRCLCNHRCVCYRNCMYIL